MAAVKETPKKPAFLTEAQFAEFVRLFGNPVTGTLEDWESPRPSNDRNGPTITETINAIFEQLRFLREDVCEGSGYADNLIGCEPRNDEKSPSGGDEPISGNVSGKLRQMLQFVTYIRGIQGDTNRRLKEGI